MGIMVKEMRIKFIEEDFVANVYDVIFSSEKISSFQSSISISFSFIIFNAGGAPAFVRNLEGMHSVLLKTIDMTQKYKLNRCYITSLNVEYLGVRKGVQYTLELAIGELEQVA